MKLLPHLCSALLLAACGSSAAPAPAKPEPNPKSQDKEPPIERAVQSEIDTEELARAIAVLTARVEGEGQPFGDFDWQAGGAIEVQLPGEGGTAGVGTSSGDIRQGYRAADMTFDLARSRPTGGPAWVADGLARQRTALRRCRSNFGIVRVVLHHDVDNVEVEVGATTDGEVCAADAVRGARFHVPADATPGTVTIDLTY